jgi:hypothetical protein
MAAVDRRQVEDGLEEIFRSETGASVRALLKMAVPELLTRLEDWLPGAMSQAFKGAVFLTTVENTALSRGRRETRTRRRDPIYLSNA